MKVNKILKMAKQLEISPEELVHDLAAIDLLSDNFKNMLSTVLFTASLEDDGDLKYFDNKKEELLKYFNDDVDKVEKMIESMKQQTEKEASFIGFIHEFLDYPVMEK